MKIREGFILREVAGTFVIISSGAENLDFKGIITVNEVGALIWKCVDEGLGKEEIVDKILSEYDVKREIASVDCDEFLEQLISKNIIER